MRDFPKQLTETALLKQLANIVLIPLLSSRDSKEYSRVRGLIEFLCARVSNVRSELARATAPRETNVVGCFAMDECIFMHVSPLLSETVKSEKRAPVIPESGNGSQNRQDTRMFDTSGLPA